MNTHVWPFCEWHFAFLRKGICQYIWVWCHGGACVWERCLSAPGWWRTDTRTHGSYYKGIQLSQKFLAATAASTNAHCLSSLSYFCRWGKKLFVYNSSIIIKRKKWRSVDINVTLLSQQLSLSGCWIYSCYFCFSFSFTTWLLFLHSFLGYLIEM